MRPPARPAKRPGSRCCNGKPLFFCGRGPSFRRKKAPSRTHPQESLPRMEMGFPPLVRPGEAGEREKEGPSRTHPENASPGWSKRFLSESVPVRQAINRRMPCTTAHGAAARPPSFRIRNASASESINKLRRRAGVYLRAPVHRVPCRFAPVTLRHFLSCRLPRRKPSGFPP